MQKHCTDAGFCITPKSTHLYGQAACYSAKSSTMRVWVANYGEYDAMNGIEDWKPFSWHCANCGKIVIGYMKQNGNIKVECQYCHVVMIRKIKGRRYDTIDVYAPTSLEG